MKNKKPNRKPAKVLLPTIEKHLKKNLSGETLKQALKNTPNARKKIRVSKPSEALFQAFQFQNTPQGFEFWKNTFDSLKSKENAS